MPAECLSAPLTYNEYKESDRLDSESRYEQKTDAQKKVAARNKAYREANKEEIAARKKAYREANRDKLADKQSCIRTVRKSHGMRQSDLAQLVGVSHGAISAWELGTLPANWDKLCAVLPELEKYRP